MNHCVVISVQCTDRSLDLGSDFTVGQTEAVGNHRVKDDVGVGAAGHHAEIVNVDLVIDAVNQCCDFLLHFIGNIMNHCIE